MILIMQTGANWQQVATPLIYSLAQLAQSQCRWVACWLSTAVSSATHDKAGASAPHLSCWGRGMRGKQWGTSKTWYSKPGLDDLQCSYPIIRPTLILLKTLKHYDDKRLVNLSSIGHAVAAGTNENLLVWCTWMFHLVMALFDIFILVPP